MTFGIGQRLQAIKLTRFHSLTLEFRKLMIEIQPLMRVVTASDDFLLAEVRTTVQVTRLDIVGTAIKPLYLGTVWDMGVAWRLGIPQFLNAHPEVARAVRPLPPPGIVLAGTGKSGGPPVVTLSYTSIPEPVGTG